MLRYDNRWIACVANGTPLSVRIATGNPYFPERPLEDRPRRDGLRREERMAGQKETSMLIGDRERIAVLPIARAKLAFVVGRPQIVRRGGGRADHARMSRRPPGPALLHQAATCSAGPRLG